MMEELSAKKFKSDDHSEEMVIMVTGGRGLVGMGLKVEVERVPSDKERWIFLTSADGDLRFVWSVMEVMGC